MISETLRENLLAIAVSYTRATGGTMTATSKRFYGNAGFFEDFKSRKCSVSIDKYDQIVEKFKASWPHDAQWPITRAAIIQRPAAKKR